MNYDLFRTRCSHGTRGKRKLNKKKFQVMYKKLEKSRDMISINWQVTLSWVQNKIWGWKNCWRWNGKIYALWWWGQKQRLGCLISTFRDIRNICEYKVKRVNMKVAELQEISLDRGGWENVRIWYWIIYMGIKIPNLGDMSGGTEEVGAKFIHEIERWGTDMIWYLSFVAFLLFICFCTRSSLLCTGFL